MNRIYKNPVWRRLVWLALVIWAVTILGFFLDLHNSGSKIVCLLFSSWMGDVLFFSLVGIAVTVISTFPAALEPFEHRARILLQENQGSEFDYAISVLSRLGNYSEQTNIALAVHDDDQHHLRIISTETFELRNFIGDVTTVYPFTVRDDEQRNNPIIKRPEVLSFEINNAPHFSRPNNNGEQVYDVEVLSGSTTKVKFVRQYYLSDEFKVAYTPIRFTKLLVLSVINRASQKVRVEVNCPRNHSTAYEIEAMQTIEAKVLEGLHDLLPDKRAFEIQLVPGSLSQALSAPLTTS